MPLQRSSNMKSILVFILIIGLITANPTDHPKKYYVFKLAKINWYGAVADCLSRNLQLATVNSEAEQSAIEKAMKDAGGEKDNFWLSGTDLADEGTYLWMSTGRGISYTNWLQGQPDNYLQNEHCMHIWNAQDFGMWNDSPCLGKLFHICEDKPDQRINVVVEC